VSQQLFCCYFAQINIVFIVIFYVPLSVVYGTSGGGLVPVGRGHWAFLGGGVKRFTAEKIKKTP